MRKQFKFIDLFAGIGGFHLGLAKIGGECVFASEILAIARETYKQNFGFEPHGDITKIKATSIPDHDILCAGFPCQAFSNVGKKKGLEDPRGELVFEIFRILKKKRPSAFILENVRGLLSNNKGETFKIIVYNLNKLGYNVKFQVLEAKDYGLPQIRKRLFIVGVKKTLNKEFCFPTPIGLKYKLNQIFKGKVDREFGYTVRIGGRRSGINNRYNWDAYRINGNVRYILPNECMRLQGFPAKFKLKGTEAQQYFQVGNAVPVTIVTEIGKKLMECKVI